MVPRKLFSEEDLIEKMTSDLSYTNNDLRSINECLLETTYEYIDRGGKRIRPILAILIAECLQDEFTNHDIFGLSAVSLGEILGAVGEVIHNGSLVIDDIEDKSDFRRGKPCLHILKGDDIAINVGCFMYFQPLARLT